MKKFAILLVMIFCCNCKPLPNYEANSLYEAPSMTKLASYNYNTLCFNVIDYKDEQNYVLSINAESKVTLYVTIFNNEIQSIKYKGNVKDLPVIQDVITEIKSRSR